MSYENLVREIFDKKDIDAYNDAWGQADEDLVLHQSESESDSGNSSSEEVFCEVFADSETCDNLDTVDADESDELDENTLVATREVLDKFTCKCHPNSSCIGKIPHQDLHSYLYEFHINEKPFTRFEKRIIVSTLLHTLIPPSEHDSKHKHILYKLCGRDVCKDAFMYVLNISKWYIASIRKTIKKDSVLVKRESVKNKKQGTGTIDTVIVSFIRGYAQVHGAPSPSAIRKKRNNYDTQEDPIVFLPRGTQKINLYKLLNDLLEDIEFDIEIKERYFYRVWDEKCKNIKIMKTGSDFCDFCTKYTPLAKTDASARQKLNEHKSKAKVEREFYVKQCRNPFMRHCTFDFAQSVHLPYFVMQPGSFYYKVGRVVRIFGICCETKHEQMNYIIPEGCYPAKGRNSGKGPNLVINLLHHYITNYCGNDRNLRFHADSCGGQNKNMYVFYYLIWCVMTGILESVHLSFMLPGHAKAMVDRWFGIFKSLMKHMDVKTVEEFARLIEMSSKGNRAHNCSTDPPEFYNWKEFLLNFFNSGGVPKIKNEVSIIEVTCYNGVLKVILKKDSRDEGYEWKNFLGRNSNVTTASKSTVSTALKEEVLEMTDTRKKYLIEKVVEPYFDEKDISKALYFNLNSLDEYNELRQGLKAGTVEVP